KLPRYFPMMMTAAGTVKPASVLILGAGVAGLQAIATARKLGAKVQVFDVRKAVKEEVQSLGAKFVEVEGSSDNKDAGGYAIDQTSDYKDRQKQAIHDSVKKADVVITTAQLRGREAPILVTKAMVEDMKPGSVIIDLASSTGGNCEVTKDNQEINHKGVTVIGDSSLYNRAIIDASSLLANNIHNYVATFIKEGTLNINMDNEIISGSMVHPKSK
ncbi:MAG: NAD(P)(+) transhydrogenase (Re/Si-specific) subunit alpha, partial [Saprospiraceae bacterium]